MKKLLVLPAVLALVACDPAEQDAKKVCKEMEATQNYTYTANEMTQKSCACTLAATRKALEDPDWQKFLVLINGGDPFTEVTDGAEGALQTPPALLRIETASTNAIQVCASEK